MKNYKPKVRCLEEYQVAALKNMGFYSPRLGGREEFDKNAKFIQKSYYMCGGSFRLNIRLNSYYFEDTYCPAYVGLESPYDSWWHQDWSIKEFTDGVKAFYEELNGDIGALVALEIIEEKEEEKENMNLEAYVIQSLEDDSYHSGDGNMSDRLIDAEFYADDKLAKNVLSTFDEPDEFKIKKIDVVLQFDIEE